jgi:cytoskeletal protein CcmA (bactofilin family)
LAWALFDRKQQGSGEWSGFLERGVRVEGKLEAPGTFRVDAQIKGQLASEDTLVLAEHAVVEGEITGNTVIVGGRFDGRIRARGKVEIQTGAVVTGEIHTGCLVIESGAMFDGQCHMATGSDATKELTIPIRSVSSHG